METCRKGMAGENPRLRIDLDKLRENSRTMVDLCNSKGISLMGVTKSYSADTLITKAFYDGGIREFADSRLENIIKSKKCGIDGPFMLLRIPMASQADDIVRYADMSVNSEISTIRLLNESAIKTGVRHGVMLMIDVGDLREGILPEEVDDVVPEILKCKNIDFFGIGTNLGCYGGVVPSNENLSILVDIANQIHMSYKHKIRIISAGGTSVVKLIEENDIPSGVNQVRLGEALMSGIDSVNSGRHINGLWKDAFTLIAEVVELKVKPSVPVGSRGPNAFNEVQEFEDLGLRKRAILAIGKQDIFMDRITPYRDGIEVLGGSSDHFLLDVTDCGDEIAVGDEIAFNITWDNVLRLTTSPYVKREYIKNK